MPVITIRISVASRRHCCQLTGAHYIYTAPGVGQCRRRRRRGGVRSREMSFRRSAAAPICGGYNYDSTSIRRPFDGLSKVIEVTVTVTPLATVTLTYGTDTWRYRQRRCSLETRVSSRDVSRHIFARICHGSVSRRIHVLSLLESRSSMSRIGSVSRLSWCVLASG